MTDFLLKHFVKDYESVEKVSVRTAYGVLSSMVGIACNVVLFIVKFIIGFVMHSVSVTADAFNNLSDAGSSIISLGAKSINDAVLNEWEKLKEKKNLTEVKPMLTLVQSDTLTMGKQL